MQGYVARKGDRYYAVIYEGIDPITGRERRRWHPAGTDRADAETARRRARRRRRETTDTSDLRLTVAVYLTQRWLPSKQLTSADKHVRRIPAQHRPPRHARDRADLAAPPPGRSPRASLRRPPDDGRADGTGGLNPRPSSRST